MIAHRTLDVGDLPYFDISSQAPIWWGQMLLALIEGTMFAILIAMYFYIRTLVDPWPPPGIQLPPWGAATFAWIPLLISSAGSYIASEGAKKNERGRMIAGLLLNLLMALAFLAMRAWVFKFQTFYKRLNTSMLSSKDHLYELYYEGKLNIEMYKSFAYTLVPLTLMGVGLRVVSRANENMRLVFQAAHTHQSVAVGLVAGFLFAVLLMMLLVNLWVKLYYGKYLDQIKKVLNEFREA